MRCAVPSCQRHSADVSSRGITFYTFPTQPELRAAVLAALEEEGWQPANGGAVCSDHLVADVEVCRICLATGCRLYAMRDHEDLDQEFRRLTGLAPEGLPGGVCAACARRLRGGARLRAPSLRAHETLLRARDAHGRITLESLNRTGGVGYFCSELSVRLAPPDHYDLHVVHVKMEDTVPDDHCYSLRSRAAGDVKAERENVGSDGDGDAVSPSAPCIHLYGERDDDICQENVSYKDTEAESEEDGEEAEEVEEAEERMETKEVEETEEHEEIEEAEDRENLERWDDPVEDVHVTATEDDRAVGEERSAGAGVGAPVRDERGRVIGFVRAGGAAASPHPPPSPPPAPHPVTPAPGAPAAAAAALSCDLCPYQTARETRLLTHLRAHGASNTYACKFCHYKTAHEHQLRRHFKTHFSGGPHPCRVCQEPFDDKHQLRRHLAARSCERRCPCEVCALALASGGGGPLQPTTPDTTRAGEEPTSRDVCNERVCSMSSDISHLRERYGEVNSCHVCNETFGTRRRLKIHFNSHPGERPHPCNVYTKGFWSRSNLKRHLRVHTGEKPYSCNVCKKAFTQKGYLRLHLMNHRGVKPYSCDVCNKKFVCKARLTVHFRTHSGVRPYSCNICEKSYYEKHSLGSHLKTHADDKPHSCNICEKKFIRKVTLKKHLRTHSGEKQIV